MIIKNTAPGIQTWRFLSQVFFVLLLLFIGWQFTLYVGWLDSGGVGDPPRRPPGAEGFLPIASFMSLSYMLQTGQIHPVHPAGLFIFLGIIIMSWLAGKSFCSWVCPFGFLSETLEQVQRKFFKKPLSLPRWLDWPLRSLKYLLLGFFLFAILQMGARELLAYLNGPYHAVSDVKMYRFFAQIAPFTLYTLMVLFALSLIIPYFWCRYLCPYGALLGFIGLLSPNRITRVESSCIDCAKCAKVCPARIKVDQVKQVRSDECTSCYQCVDACPVKDTLVIMNRPAKRALTKRTMAFVILGSFFLLLGLGMITDNWQSSITPEKALELYPGIDTYIHTN